MDVKLDVAEKIEANAAPRSALAAPDSYVRLETIGQQGVGQTLGVTDAHG